MSELRSQGRGQVYGGLAMAYYWTCPDCGANLDPSEKCSDCEINYKEDMGYEDVSEEDAHRELQGVQG